MDLSQQASFIWSIAEVAHFVFKPAEYGKVILPFTVLRRLECVLEPTKAAVWAEAERLKKPEVDNPSPFLKRASGFGFYNVSRLDLPTIAGDPNHVAENIKDYLDGFSPELRTMFERFKFDDVLKTCAEKGILYEIVKQFSTIDLHPDVIPNTGMGEIFERLIHKFSDAQNEEAGEYFTPPRRHRTDGTSHLYRGLRSADSWKFCRPYYLRSYLRNRRHAVHGGRISAGL